jgi:hypothetical protein
MTRKPSIRNPLLFCFTSRLRRVHNRRFRCRGAHKSTSVAGPRVTLITLPLLPTGNSRSRRFRCRVVHKNTFGWFAIFKLGHRLVNTRWSAQGPGTGGQHKVPAQGSRHKVRDPPPAQGPRPPPAQGRHKVFWGRVREEGLPRATIYIYIYIYIYPRALRASPPPCPFETAFTVCFIFKFY